jgi:hypothetical protein
MPRGLHINWGRSGVTRAIGAGETVLIDIGDALFEQVGNQVAVLDGLLESVGEDRVAEVVVGVPALFRGGEWTFDFLKFPRCGSEAKLETCGCLRAGRG